MGREIVLNKYKEILTYSEIINGKELFGLSVNGIKTKPISTEPITKECIGTGIYEKYFVYSNKKKYGLININGDIIVDAEYTNKKFIFYDNIAMVDKKDLMGYIKLEDDKFEKITEIKYIQGINFKNGFAIVSENQNLGYGVINDKGYTVVMSSNNYSKAELESFFSNFETEEIKELNYYVEFLYENNSIDILSVINSSVSIDLYIENIKMLVSNIRVNDVINYNEEL